MTTEDTSDWRLLSQEHMHGLELEWSVYTIYREGWDHDHCQFCWETISLAPGGTNEGYCTPDQYRWVCRSCFEDFETHFAWKVSRRAPDQST